MKRIIIILAFLVCGISSAQQYFFNGTVYVPKTTVQINAIVSPPEGRTEANSDTGSLWYFDGTIWKDTFVGVSSFADLEGDPYDNAMLSDALNSKAADSTVVKTSVDSQIQNLKLAVGDSAWIASKTFGANDIVINTDENPPGGDNYVTGGTLSGAGVLSLEMNYGPNITVPGFNSGSGYLPLSGGVMTGTINMGDNDINNVNLLRYRKIGGIIGDRRVATGLYGEVYFGINPSLDNVPQGELVYTFTEDLWLTRAMRLTSLVGTGDRVVIAKPDGDLDFQSGATGTFTSQDGKTITVTNGIITNISTP